MSTSLTGRALRVWRSEGPAGLARRIAIRLGLRRIPRWTRRVPAVQGPENVHLHLDSPSLRGSEPPRLSGRVWLNGWAVAPKGVGGIEVRFDGSSLGAAHQGITRPDVGGLFPDYPDAWKAGFVFPLETSAYADGPHTLSVVTETGAGTKEFAIPVVIDNSASGYDRWLALRGGPHPPPAVPPPKESPAATAVRFAIALDGTFGDASAATLDSLRGQTHADWRLLDAPHDPSPAAPGDYILPLSPGDRLARHALATLAERLVAAKPMVELIYADEDRIDADGRRTDPFFKPGYSPTLLGAAHYLGRPWAVRAGALTERALAWPKAAGLEAEHGLLAALAESNIDAAHVPDVLCSRPSGADPLPVNPAPPAPGGRPKVSVIIPTKAGTELVRGCLKALVANTSYSDLEIVLVANPAAHDPAAAAFLSDFPARKVTVDGPFNWSRCNNLGADAASGEVLVFANDDLEPIAQDWVEAMLAYALRPRVGAVGAKLLYGDRRVQHAGVFLCPEGGGSRHSFRFLAGDDPGPYGLAALPREVIAVTGACLMVSREKFDRIGRFDETLALVNNDIDFCLRGHELGLESVVVPVALLFHHEGVTRQAMPETEDVKRFRSRWSAYYPDGGSVDPYFNPNLDPGRDDYVLKG